MNSRYQLFRRCIPFVVLCAAVLLSSGIANACPNCKAGLSTSDAQAKSMAAGYYYSILFMLSMPFLIVTSFTGWMYLAVRKAKAEREAKAAIQDSPEESMEADAESASPVGSMRD